MVWVERMTVLGLILGCVGCNGNNSGPVDAGAAGPSRVHLTQVLPQAELVAAPTPSLAPMDWTASDLSTWRVVGADTFGHLGTLESELVGDVLRLNYGPSPSPGLPLSMAGIVVDLEPTPFEDWDVVLVEARTRDRFAGVTVGVNLGTLESLPGFMRFFNSTGDTPPIFSDGSTQTYAVPVQKGEQQGEIERITNLGVFFASPSHASIEVVSVRLVPRGANYNKSVGVHAVERGGTTRDSLFAHTPSNLTFPISQTEDSRLDLGLSGSQGDVLTYRIISESDSGEELLHERNIEAADEWYQLSVPIAAGTKGLRLEAESERSGAVAIWGAPVLSTVGNSATAESSPPNVVFYIVDGGDADFMSLYQYDRPTTPFLKEFASEGVVFERAHSNASWTQPSTVSFMTSLQHSVLGGLRRGIHSTPVPTAAVTMAEHFKRGGYGTASFTANPNAGRLVGIERGVDYMRDGATENHATSSVALHEEFWKFRDAYPEGPFWVHFQTTDVHEPFHPEDPFAGQFVSPEELAQHQEWDGQMWGQMIADFGQTSIEDLYNRGLERAGIDRHAYYDTRRGLYDESMTHQDHMLGQFVQELKDRGEWENTIFILGADHGHPAGTFSRFGRGLLEPQPEPWQGGLIDAYATRIPLLVVWPGKIDGGLRIDRPVSMLDVLPTVLELAGLPPAAVAQGQSLAPLLAREEIELRPVILDEFRVDDATGEMIGNLDIIDGRWGASLEIGPVAQGSDPALGRHTAPAGGRWGAVHPYFEEVPRLLLYDLENDPFARHAVNDEHPDLVRKYTRMLQDQWRAHQALATQFEEAGNITLDPEQLEQLKALGYIQ